MGEDAWEAARVEKPIGEPSLPAVFFDPGTAQKTKRSEDFLWISHLVLCFLSVLLALP